MILFDVLVLTCYNNFNIVTHPISLGRFVHNDWEVNMRKLRITSLLLVLCLICTVTIHGQASIATTIETSATPAELTQQLVDQLGSKYGRSRVDLDNLEKISSPAVMSLTYDMIDVFQATDGWLTMPVRLQKSSIELVTTRKTANGETRLIKWHKEIALPDGGLWLEVERLTIDFVFDGTSWMIDSFLSDDFDSMETIRYKRATNIPMRQP